MAIAGYTYFILFVLLIITKTYLPNAWGGLNNPPIFDYIYILGLGICVSILGISYAYYSWTLKPEEYSEWFAVQQNNFEAWLGRTDSFPSDNRVLWSSRIAGPFGALMGIVISILMMVAIFNYFLR